MEKIIRTNKNKTTTPNSIPGRFETQAISQPNKRQNKTDVALPDNENVVRARNWVIENQK